MVQCLTYNHNPVMLMKALHEGKREQKEVKIALDFSCFQQQSHSNGDHPKGEPVKRSFNLGAESIMTETPRDTGRKHKRAQHFRFETAELTANNHPPISSFWAWAFSKPFLAHDLAFEDLIARLMLWLLVACMVGCGIAGLIYLYTPTIVLPAFGMLPPEVLLALSGFVMALALCLGLHNLQQMTDHTARAWWHLKWFFVALLATPLVAVLATLSPTVLSAAATIAAYMSIPTNWTFIASLGMALGANWLGFELIGCFARGVVAVWPKNKGATQKQALAQKKQLKSHAETSLETNKPQEPLSHMDRLTHIMSNDKALSVEDFEQTWESINQDQQSQRQYAQNSALHLSLIESAASAGNVALFKHLLSKQQFQQAVNQYIEKIEHHEALQELLAHTVHEGHKDFFQHMLNHNQNATQKTSASKNTQGSKKTALFQFDINQTRSNRGSETWLIRAISQKQSEIALQLINHPDIDINATDAFGQTALMHATRRGLLDLVNAMLQQHAKTIDLSITNTRGDSALTIATTGEQNKLQAQCQNQNTKNYTQIKTSLEVHGKTYRPKQSSTKEAITETLGGRKKPTDQRNQPPTNAYGEPWHGPIAAAKAFRDSLQPKENNPTVANGSVNPASKQPN